MEFGGIADKIKGVLGAIGREMDRWDEADRRLGTRVWQEIDPQTPGRQLRESVLSLQGTFCRDYGRPGVMERAREIREAEAAVRWGRKS